MSVEVKRRIIEGVRELIAMEPISLNNVSRWYNRAEEIKSLMSMDDGNIGVPHALWHYLEDLDIRMKDCVYAECQIVHIKEILRDWER